MEVDIFRDILNYAYTGKICITVSNAFDLYIAADFLGIEFIMNSADKYLCKDINMDNIFVLSDFSFKYNLPELKRLTNMFFSDNLQYLSKTESFNTLDPSIVHQILSNDQSSGKIADFPDGFEIEVLRAALSYLSTNLHLMEEPVFEDILSSVRYPFIPSKLVKQEFSKYKFFQKNFLILKYIDAATKAEDKFKRIMSNDFRRLPESWTHCRAQFSTCRFRVVRCMLGHQPSEPFETKPSPFDPCLEIECINIYARENNHIVYISGLLVCYRRMGKKCNLDYVRGDNIQTGAKYTVNLKQGEFVRSVKVSCYDKNVVAGIEFETNCGKKFGPFGSFGKSSYAFSGSGGLYDMSCTVNKVVHAICNLSLMWKDPTEKQNHKLFSIIN